MSKPDDIENKERLGVAGNWLPAALARLIEAFECHQDRARFVLRWEGLLGRHGSNRNLPNETDQNLIGTSEESALSEVASATMHRGYRQVLEYERLLDAWYASNSYPEKGESFELQNYLDENEFHWYEFGRVLTPKEEREWFGRSLDDIERLRRGDAEEISRLREELESRYRNHPCDVRQELIKAQLSDIPHLAEKMEYEYLFDEVFREFRRWEVIEGHRVRQEHLSRHTSAEFNPFCIEKDFPPEVQEDVSFLRHRADSFWDAKSVEEIKNDLEEARASLQRVISFSEGRAESEELAREREIFALVRKEQGLPPIGMGLNWYRYYEALKTQWASEAQQSKHQRIGESKFEVQWAKEVVGMLSTLLKRNAELEAHPMTKTDERIPVSIRVLFEQAHLSYLFDFDIPCTLTCGALVEEAFQSRFQKMFDEWDRQFIEAKRRFKEANGLGEKPQALAFFAKIDKVIEQNPSVAPAKQLANRIWAARTQAMHHPEEYVRQVRYKSKDVLFDTRKVLGILFEAEHSR
jgi:hypothetical protein